MGKSKGVRRADVQALRAFRQRRKTAKITVYATGAMFVLAVSFAGGFRGERSWIVFVLLGAFILANVWLRMCSHCPFCGKPILGQFESFSHCPNCRRAIKPDAGDAAARLK